MRLFSLFLSLILAGPVDRQAVTGSAQIGHEIGNSIGAALGKALIVLVRSKITGMSRELD